MTRRRMAFGDELLKLSATSGEETLADTHLIDEAYRKARAQARRSLALKGLRGESAPRTRDYLASALIGALAAPAVGLAGNAVGRLLRNRLVRREMARAATAAERARFEALLERGPVLGRHVPAAHGLPGRRPLMGYDELAGRAAAGTLTGSVVQMVRDRLSGSVAVDAPR